MADTELIPRHLSTVVDGLLAEEPVLLLSGPRAVGKTTLITTVAQTRKVDVIDLSDRNERIAAELDPDAFLADRPEPVVIDEYQLVPELLRVVKRSVDRRPRAGAYLLTGSTTGEILPRGTESLAGRVHQLILSGLSQGELAGHLDGFIDLVFNSPGDLRSHRDRTTTRVDYCDRIVTGGFPLATRRTTDVSRRRWLTDYASRILDRDLADLVKVRQPAVFRQTVSACAARTAQVTNLSELANDLAVGRDAVRNYVELLERVFIVTRIPAFSRNPNARIAKHPKLHLTDSGLAAALMGYDTSTLSRIPAMGALLETFVAGEVQKQSGWSTTPFRLSHFRDRDGHEVDLVLESAAGDVVGIEVKASTSVASADTRGLRRLADHVGADSFHHGVVLYTGANTIRLDDDRFTACPVSSLWSV